MKFSSLDGSENDEHNDIGFTKISKIFAMRDAFLPGTDPFDRVF